MLLNLVKTSQAYRVEDLDTGAEVALFIERWKALDFMKRRESLPLSR